jgi:hypothetical protein
MSQTWIRVTRAQLYEKAWATPIRTLAKEFGLSDVGLAKICRKHNIPVPPVGYWRKKETGHRVKRPALLPVENGNETVVICVRERLSSDLAALAAEVAPKIAIPQELSHAFVLRTEKLLAHGKENEKKLLMPKKGVSSHILVSKERLPRGLLLLNAFFLALEETGQSISWPKDEGSHLTLCVDGETIGFSLQEVTSSTPHVLSISEKARPWMAPRWDFKLSGQLQFRVEDLPYLIGPIRRTWSDGKQQRLENCLGNLIVGLKVAAAAIKKARHESTERQRQRDEEQKRREEARRTADEQKRRAEFVTDLTQDWEQAERLRRFVKALESSAPQLDLSDDEQRDVRQIVDWTCKYADLVDPLLDLPKSIGEFVRPEKRYSWLK